MRAEFLWLLAPLAVVVAVWLGRRIVGARLERRHVHRLGPAADAWPENTDREKTTRRT